MSYKSTLQEHNILLQQAIDKANALPDAGGGGSGLPTQEKTKNVTENGIVEVVPDAGYTLSKVTVNVNVTAGTTETWTFLMEDGSEVTKDVVVA